MTRTYAREGFTHEHRYDVHPRMTTHLACTVCGFAAPLSAIRTHVKNGSALILSDAARVMTTETHGAKRSNPDCECEACLFAPVGCTCSPGMTPDSDCPICGDDVAPFCGGCGRSKPSGQPYCETCQPARGESLKTYRVNNGPVPRVTR